jgi:uncharacterized protein
VKRHDTARTRVLVAQRIDVNALQPDGTTALHWAAHWDDLEATDLLVKAGANPDAANHYGVTPLFLACTNGGGAVVRRLLAAGANNVALPSGDTPLMTCARTGKLTR